MKEPATSEGTSSAAHVVSVPSDTPPASAPKRTRTTPSEETTTASLRREIVTSPRALVA